MITMYGIPNCDTIKKAKKWLADQDIDFDFHDYKKQGIDAKTLKTWLQQQPWDVLVNKRGTTWRQLPANVKETMDESSAVTAMIDNPSLIKRPVLVLTSNQILVGFKPETYEEAIK